MTATGRQILITGATTLAGGHTVQRLACEGFGRLWLLSRGRDYDLLRRIVAKLPRRSRIQFVQGDLVEPDLGLDEKTASEIRGSVSHVVHAAARNHLEASQEAAYAINVIAGENLLAFARACPQLRAFVCLSTAFVSGLRRGRIREAELEHDAGFRNAYEATRYLFEQRLRAAMSALPIAVLRSGLLVGAHASGRLRLQGPAAIIDRLGRLEHYGVLRLLPVPHLGGDQDDVHLPFTPVETTVDATLALLRGPGSYSSRTLHLTDPDAPTIGRFLDELRRGYALEETPRELPLALLRLGLRLPGARWLSGIHPAELEYLDVRAVYDTEGAREFLERSEIEIPHYDRYLGGLIRQARGQFHVSSALAAVGHEEG